ncbi:hypothetical protein DV736_g3035, partial [Chaetothyriales sp. CBS 134916]
MGNEASREAAADSHVDANRDDALEPQDYFDLSAIADGIDSSEPDEEGEVSVKALVNSKAKQALKATKRTRGHELEGAPQLVLKPAEWEPSDEERWRVRLESPEMHGHYDVSERDDPVGTVADEGEDDDDDILRILNGESHGSDHPDGPAEESPTEQLLDNGRPDDMPSACSRASSHTSVPDDDPGKMELDPSPDVRIEPPTHNAASRGRVQIFDYVEIPARRTVKPDDPEDDASDIAPSGKKLKSQCPHCPKSFGAPSKINRHMLVHAPPQFICPFCDNGTERLFRRRDKAIDHIKRCHSSQQLKDASHMTLHIDNPRAHDELANSSPSVQAAANSLRFPCPFAAKYSCSKTFKQQNAAVRHGYTHIEEYPCICGKVFQRNDNLMAHFRIKHRHTDIHLLMPRAKPISPSQENVQRDLHPKRGSNQTSKKRKLPADLHTKTSDHPARLPHKKSRTAESSTSHDTLDSGIAMAGDDHHNPSPSRQSPAPSTDPRSMDKGNDESVTIPESASRSWPSVRRRHLGPLQYADNIKKGAWSVDESIKFNQAIDQVQQSTLRSPGGRFNWQAVSDKVETRTPQQCSSHWRSIHGTPIGNRRRKSAVPDTSARLSRMEQRLNSEFPSNLSPEPILNSDEEAVLNSAPLSDAGSSHHQPIPEGARHLSSPTINDVIHDSDPDTQRGIAASNDHRMPDRTSHPQTERDGEISQAQPTADEALHFSSAITNGATYGTHSDTEQDTNMEVNDPPTTNAELSGEELLPKSFPVMQTPRTSIALSQAFEQTQAHTSDYRQPQTPHILTPSQDRPSPSVAIELRIQRSTPVLPLQGSPSSAADVVMSEQFSSSEDSDSDSSTTSLTSAEASKKDNASSHGTDSEESDNTTASSTSAPAFRRDEASSHGTDSEESGSETTSPPSAGVHIQTPSINVQRTPAHSSFHPRARSDSGGSAHSQDKHDQASACIGYVSYLFKVAVREVAMPEHSHSPNLTATTTRDPDIQPQDPTAQSGPTCGGQVRTFERIALNCDYLPPTAEGAKAVAAAEVVINSTTTIDRPVTAANPNHTARYSPPPFCLPPLSCPLTGPVEKWPLGSPQHCEHPDPAMRTHRCSPCQRLLAAWHKQGLRCAAYDARGFFVFDIDMLEMRDQIRSTFMVERGLLSFHYLLTGCMGRQLGATTNRFFNPGRRCALPDVAPAS